MSIRTILLEICQRAGLDARMGYESGASAFLSAAGSRPCAYVSYSRDAVPAAGYDTASVYFGGSDPAAARARVEGLLDRSLDVSSLREMGGEWLSFVITAKAKKRIYNVMGLGGSPSPAPTTKSPMYLEAAEANSTVGMVSTLETAPNLEYSTDGVTWQAWEYTTAEGTHTFDTITLGAVGDKVYFRGDNPNGLGYTDGDEIWQTSTFVLTGAVKGGGNVMSLLDKTMELTVVPQFGFMGLFAIMGGGIEPALLTPPSMETITTIGDNGCTEMYSGCTSLTAAADMSSLTTIGDHGCDSMYGGCTSLTAAADMSSLTTIGDYGCYGMYYDCTSLTAAADMPTLTTIGDHGCDSMYGGCTSLTAAADMPSLTTIGDYGCNGMYGGCTSLTAAADMPSLTTIGDHGCQEMYLGCTSLTAAADMPSLTTIGEGGCAVMYLDCTSLTAAADMSSLTTIGDHGCDSMYGGCTSLTAAADMPTLTTIGEGGCAGMYRNCTFNMSNDGTTLNFSFPTPPITAGDYTYSTAYDVAQWMGNTNGFGG